MGLIPTGGFITTDIKTRFFDKIDLSYYLTDDFKISLGHRYEGGLNAAALSGEYAFDLGRTMASLFVEARIGEDNFRGVWGGVRFYFGQHDKTLIRRQREDDPVNWLPDVTALTSPKNSGFAHGVATATSSAAGIATATTAAAGIAATSATSATSAATTTTSTSTSAAIRFLMPIRAGSRYRRKRKKPDWAR